MIESVTIEDLLRGSQWRGIYRALPREDRRTVQLAAGRPEVADSSLIAALAIRMSRRQLTVGAMVAALAAGGFVALGVLAGSLRTPALVSAAGSLATVVYVWRTFTKPAIDFNRSIVARGPRRVRLDEGLVPSRVQAARARREAGRRLPRQALVFVATVIVLMGLGYGLRLFLTAI